MKTTNLATRWAALALAVSVSAAACGKMASSDGGDTHWLGDCDTDRDCASGECLCGICTKTCSGDNACLASAKGAACFEVDSPGVKARWNVFTEDGSAMPIGLKFNIMIRP